MSTRRHSQDHGEQVELHSYDRTPETSAQPSQTVILSGSETGHSGSSTAGGSSGRRSEEPDGHPMHRIEPRLFYVRTGRTSDDNVYSRMENPFSGWLSDQVETVAKRIALEYGLRNLEGLFVKAARVLEDPYPQSWESWDYPESERLTEEEIRALKLEPKARFWDQPWPLKTTFLMLFVAAVVQGWTQTGTNGANLSWWREIGPGQGQQPHEGTTSNVGRVFARVGGIPGGGASTPSCMPIGEGIWPYAAVNAAPYLAAVFGSQLSDPLINELLFGRRGAIMLSAALVLGSSIAGAMIHHWWQLLITRIFLGIGMGCKAAVVPVFAAEIAPAHLRGSLVMNWQVFDALGIFLGFSANLLATRAGDAAWRWQVCSSAIPAFALLCGVIFVSWDSPRYLMKHEEQFLEHYNKRKTAWERRNPSQDDDTISSNGSTGDNHPPHLWARFRTATDVRPSPVLPYQSETYKTLVLLRGHPILAAKELIYTHCQLLVETTSSQLLSEQDDSMSFSLQSRSSWFGRLGEMFGRKKAHIRRAMYAAAVVMIAQQLCGVNVLIFYSSSLFCRFGTEAGNSAEWQPLLLSWGIGLANFIFSFPAYWLIDRKGRRWLLLVTLPFLALTMAGAAGAFAISDPGTRRAVVTLFTYIFMLFYSSGLGPVPFTLSAEVFPLEHRMVGMSFAVSLNFLGAGLETLIAPIIHSPSTLLGIFAGLNVIAYGFVWIYVREVIENLHKGKDHRMTSLNLEGLFHIFRLPTKMHIEYQWTIVLPYVMGCAKDKITYCFGFAARRPRRPASFRQWANSVNEAT